MRARPIVTLVTAALLVSGPLAAPAASDLLVSSGVSDDSSRVIRYADDGRYLGVFACPGNGSDPPRLGTPRGMAFGPRGFYVAGFAHGEILLYDGVTGAPIGVFVAAGTGNLRNPVRLIARGSELLVTDCYAGAVRRYDIATGAALGDLVNEGSGGLSGADDMTFGPDDKLYVSSTGTGEVLRYNADGTFDRVFASGNGMIFPRGLHFDDGGRLLVNDSATNKIFRFLGTGAFDAVFAAGAPLEGGRGLFVESTGKLLVANQYASTILRYQPNGTLLGTLAVMPPLEREPSFFQTGSGILQMRASMGCAPAATTPAGVVRSMRFCLRNVGCAQEFFSYRITDTRGWIVGSDETQVDEVELGPQGEFCVTVDLRPPNGTPIGTVDSLIWVGYAEEDTVALDRCFSTLTVTGVTATLLGDFAAEPGIDRITLRYEVPDESGLAGTHVYRRDGAAGFETRRTATPIAADGRGAYSWVDHDVEPGVAYAYRLGLLMADGSETMAGLATATLSPRVFGIGPASPNPTSGPTALSIRMPHAGDARIRVLDVNGRAVRALRSGSLEAGEHVVTWDSVGDDGRTVRAGIYFVVVEAVGRRAVARLAVMR